MIHLGGYEICLLQMPVSSRVMVSWFASIVRPMPTCLKLIGPGRWIGQFFILLRTGCIFTGRNPSIMANRAEFAGGTSVADKHQLGLIGKFRVSRVDGTDSPGARHDGCRYFVLDATHDKHAAPALHAYAESCEADYPMLARDLRALAGPSDDPAMNVIGREKAEAFAAEACSVFTPSRHGNAQPSTGPFVRCVTCQKPQHQHWLRQALKA
jgi:hypothetical protein